MLIRLNCINLIFLSATSYTNKVKMNNLLFLIINFLLLFELGCATKQVSDTSSTQKKQLSPAVERIMVGAEQFDQYLPLLKGKKVGLIVNQTSVVNKTFLLDTLISRGVNVIKIFAPEHGFRGKADAGEKVNNETDSKTGLPIISLYGPNKKPSKTQLGDLDIIIFDIQDVGARFYTYISTMHYAMEACAENNKMLVVLDRPNPNGHYIDGPILQKEYKSFVGMHPIPIVHGCTVGELAQMINGEKWLDTSGICDLKVVQVKNYTHKTSYSLPIKPSPNLPNDQAINLYPSLGIFEGTNISVARGTLFPFQAIGSPNPANGSFTFTPVSIEGMSKNPPHENKLCYGIDLRSEPRASGINLSYIIKMYQASEDKEKFFNNFFKKLAGNETLQKQIAAGKSEKEIKDSWSGELANYRKIRDKYLLYRD